MLSEYVTEKVYAVSPDVVTSLAVTVAVGAVVSDEEAVPGSKNVAP